MGINVNLTPQLEELVRSKVASGQYASVSEFVCKALRLLEEQDRLTKAKQERLRGALSGGLGSGPSESWDAEAVKRHARVRRPFDSGAALSSANPIVRADRITGWGNFGGNSEDRMGENAIVAEVCGENSSAPLATTPFSVVVDLS